MRALVDKAEREDRSPRGLIEALKVLLAFVIGFAILAAVLYFIVPRRSPEDLQEAARKGNAAQASLELSTELYRSGPRRAYVGATMDPRFASYVQEYVRKVETLANASYPPEIRGIDGRVQVTVAIRFDGHIESVEVKKASGSALLDEIAVRLVRSAGPFVSFPEELRRDADVLHITRTFEFGKRDSAKAAFGD